MARSLDVVHIHFSEGKSVIRVEASHILRASPVLNQGLRSFFIAQGRHLANNSTADNLARTGCKVFKDSVQDFSLNLATFVNDYDFCEVILPVSERFGVSLHYLPIC